MLDVEIMHGRVTAKHNSMIARGCATRNSEETTPRRMFANHGFR